jgi:L-malate glycosyltransferase
MKLALVGPLPPPSGGMANQTQQLARLLAEEGIDVEIVRVNPPYRPQWTGSLRGVRALFRLIPYLLKLWAVSGRVQLFHVMANSGWSWHLWAAPAVWIAKLRRVTVVVNYRGGQAPEFLEHSSRWIRPTIHLADRLIVPSGFLREIFLRFGLNAQIIPNIIDLTRFAPRFGKAVSDRDHPHLIVTRNLEPIYDIDTALRAFTIIITVHPGARLTVAGSGPELARLTRLAQDLGISAAVTFAGRLDNERIAELYQQADVCLNPSTADNMPISILEALATGVPVVTTDVGGIPFMVEHGRSALLVPSRDPDAMARAALELLNDDVKRTLLARAGRELVAQYEWRNVRGRLLSLYSQLIQSTRERTVTEV